MGSPEPSARERHDRLESEPVGSRMLLNEVGVGLPGSCGAAYATVPNKAPTPAVIPIASAPQNVTRIMLGVTLAPPARAARAPKSARKTSKVPDTRIIRVPSGAKAETMRGMTAPTASYQPDRSWCPLAVAV